METIKSIFITLFSSVAGVVALLCATLGWAYWMWMAIQFSSFGMFLFGLLGPFALVAGALGLWSFFFGVPDWLL